MKHLRQILGLGILIALVSSAGAQSWLTNGLVAYYPFNGNANNEAGSGFNGTVNGPQTGNDRFGNASSAYYFNGAGNHIYVGDQLPDSQEFTLSVWIRSDEDKVQGVFYDAALFTPGRDTILNISVGRNMYGTATKPGVPINDPLVAPAAVAIGIWQHVVWTVRTNGSAIYINGILADASTDIGNNIGYHSAIYIGTENHGFGPDYFFHGSMDDLRIYTRGLTQTEVQQLYAYESGSSVTSFTNGLVAYYPFDGNGNDQSGNGNHSTPAGNYAFVTNGLVGGALQITGDNSIYYSGGGHALLPTFSSSMNTGFTYSVWIKIGIMGPNSSQQAAIITFGSLSSPLAEIYVNKNTSPPHLLYYMNSGGPAGPNVEFRQDVDSQTIATSWTHVVMTYAPGKIAAYLNGQKIGETNYTFNVFPVTKAALGRNWWDAGASSSSRMDAVYDNVRIYNRALSSNDVAQLYDYESGSSSPTPGLVYDDFTSTSVDTNIWEIRKTFSDSDVFVSSGNLVELNRGKLLKVGAAPTNVVISTRFKFAGNQNDVFRIVWRSNGDDSNVQNGARELLNGLRLSFQRPHSENGFVGSIGFDWINHPIAGGVIGTVQTNLLANTYYDVRIEDDGSQINIFFGSDPTPMFTGVFSPRYGDRLAFYNREGSGGGSSISAGSRVELDYIGIQDVAQTVLPPSIATQPQAISAMAGSATNFSVVATGSAPLKYQWRKDGATLPGATNASLALSNLQLSAMGNYSVVITNLAGSVTSSAAILKVSEWVVTTIAGSGLVGLSNGPALQASFNGIDELKVFPQGGMEVLVVDAGNNNVRSISGGLNPEVDVYAGSQSGSSGTNLGAPHDARFNLPLSVALGATGQVYVADTFNHRIVSIAPGTRVVSLLAGSGVAGVTDGASASASFDFPNDLAVDSAGNVFVSEFNHHVIRKITPAGQVMRFAGDGTSGYQDGEGLQARFNKPGALAIDLNDNLYVGEYVGNRVRKITPAGFVTTVAGSGMAGYADGMGTNAQFDTIASVCLDNEGNLYVGDLNRVIRQIAPSGLVQTIAGTGGIGFEDGPGRSAVFRGPAGLGWHPDGSLLVADDSGSERIRRVAKVTGAVAPSLVQQPVSVVTAAGGTVVFKTAATGSWPISYQWQKDGVNLPGENGPSLLLTNVQPTRIGDYAVIVVNGSGSATSSVASVSIPGVNSGLWQGLVAYYLLNGDVDDNGPRRADGVLTSGTFEIDRFGVANQSLRISGENSHMLASDVGLPLGNRSRTMSIWVHADTVGGFIPAFIHYGVYNGFGPSRSAFGIGHNSGGQEYFWGGNYDAVGSRALRSNNWHHCVAVYDEVGKLKLYLDGVLNSEENLPLLNTLSGNLTVGKWYQQSGFEDQFNGLIDDIRIYNRALSSNDVVQLFSSEFPDADKDGLSDYEEVNILGTDPNKSDTDGDGLTDLQEVRFRNTNPTLADTDGDGFNDYAEIYTAHDPLLNTDYPAANLSAFTAIELEFVTKVGTTYQLQTSPDLVTWTNFDNAIIGDGNLWKKTYPTRGQGRLFHRVESAP